MAFCSKCGTELVATAAFCRSCGTSITAAETKPSQGATFSTIPVVQELSADWKKTFALIEKAGGPKLPKFRELSPRETQISFNLWGFWLGPLYYLGKGMWKKAIVLFALCLPLVAITQIILKAIGVPEYLAGFIVAGVFASRANIDYYKKVVLNDNGWW